MSDFETLYHTLVTGAVRGEELTLPEGYDPHHLDCLLNPSQHAPVLRLGECDCEHASCAAACLYDAIVRDENGKITIDPERCAGCAACIAACQSGKLTESRDVLPTLDAVKRAEGPVYALVAPAILGQFGPNATMGKLRTAFKQLGFSGLIEVALFADILTLREALEFDRTIQTDADYQLTSCCCPLWISMLRKVYKDLMPHVPGSVSPMIAAGRAIKYLHPEAVTVFIGPCMAKKAEAREADVAGAVDFVLTFQETRDVFEAAKIDPTACEEAERDHSSRAGRVYARSGGVSEAVQATVHRLNPTRPIGVRTRQADGVPACRAMIDALKAGKSSANFFEGMGCSGGCVGGPKVILDSARARAQVDIYGDDAAYPTPVDNPHVIEMLHRLGIRSIPDLLQHDGIFTRRFD